ncbi:helix-turn-helix domain-containing protein [Streptomyces sp. NPDC087218]|uniref:helix-turn-helix domain-containing protein n=1 Tax=Streptomyces sp. NPDC087218 TaxID=3365769 RepID=UPI0037FCE60F
MDTQQVSAPVRAPRPVLADASTKFGVMHVKARLTSHFTVLDNRLTQHRELSLLAIGLSAHIQSLPPGARIGIKFLAQRFPDSEARIAAALRELEAHGFLLRVREHLADGRVVTRTYSYNQPHTDAPPRQAPRPAPRPTRVTPPAPVPAPVPAPAPEPTPVRSVPPAPPAPKAPPAPQPSSPPSPLLHAATELLAGLHHHTSRITLTAQDVARLAPAAAAWFERGATPADLRRALTDDLPDPLRHPAKLLRYRLTALLPPPPPAPAPPVVPLRNCDRCDRAFRSPDPGRYCRDCTTDDDATPPTDGQNRMRPSPRRAGINHYERSFPQ